MIAFFRQGRMVGFGLVFALSALGLTACTTLEVQPALRSGDIAAVTSNANMGEIEQGMSARERGQSLAVRDYAQRMVVEHSLAEERQRALFQSLGIMPLENPVSRQLASEARLLTAALHAASAEAFDLIYMDSQIMMHQRTLGLLETQMIPAARRGAMRTELTRMRTVVAEHLRQARAIRAALEGLAAPF